MRRHIVKKKLIPMIVFSLFAMMLTGCAKGLNITTEQNDVVADYVANVLLKNSYSYVNKYDDLKETFSYDYDEDETEEETETSEVETEPQTPVIDPTDAPDSPTSENQSEEPTTSDGKWHAEEAMGIEPLEVEFDSYTITKEYPDDDESFFSFEAEKGYTFIVLKFKVYNRTGKTVVVDNSQIKPAVKLYIDDKTPVLNYGNLMLNDITNLKDVNVEPTKPYDGIIVFMVPEEHTKDIKSLVIKYDEFEQKIK